MYCVVIHITNNNLQQVNVTSKNDENSTGRVEALHFSSPCDEGTNKQLRGHWWNEN